MQNLYNELIQHLNAMPGLLLPDKYGKPALNKPLIIDKALRLDTELIKILLKHQNIKKHFFTEIEGITIFDKVAFQRFVNTKKFLADNYTKFANKIGIANEDFKFIAESREMVLVWPHKDCVLEGGQTKEETKRNEIFYNTTLAPDDIDVLTAPKVLTNWKKFDKNGQTKPENIAKKDNFVIKGNNLLALCSLKATYKGQIKLIYIDPPYNTATSANTFSYNNTFNHSTWLTFMKNRLEVAKELLREDGIFVTAIDHYELFYLGVLADEIFGRENRIGVIAAVHNPGGRQDDKFFPTAHENMIFYAKNKDLVKIHSLGVSDEKLKQFKLRDKFGRYKLRGYRRNGNNSRREDGPGLYYPIYYNPQNDQISLEKSDGFIEILPIDEKGVYRCWRWSKETFLNKMGKYIEVKRVNNEYNFYVKERECDYVGEKAKTIWLNNKYTGQTGTHSLKALFGEKIFTYPKSPYIIRDVLKIITEPNNNDIILDFFAGSGTTAHAVLELNREDGGNRRFILCEQMDYIETVTVARVQKVIEKLQEDSFIFCELQKSNQYFVDSIQNAENSAELLEIWAEMQKTAFLSYKILPEMINSEIKEFENLEFAEQQRFLIEVLDKNLLYVNFSEISDVTHSVSDFDKKMSANFYEM